MRIVKSASSSRVAKNTVWLFALQLINFAAPLLVLPFLTRSLETEEFGAVMVAISLTQLSLVVTDYGFSLSATDRISRNRDDQTYIKKLIRRIFSAKIVLTLIALLLLFIVSLIGDYKNYNLIFYSALLVVPAQAFQTPWLFQGLEMMRGFVSYMTLTKIFYVICVLLFVNEPGDGAIVLLSLALANSVGAFASIAMARKLGYSPSFGKFNEALAELKESSSFFWSRAAVAIYTSASTVTVGLSGLHQAAMFSAAEQVYKAGQAVTNPLSQALYPYMSREKNLKSYFRIIPVVGLIFACGCLGVWFFRSPLIITVFGASYIDAVPVVSVFLMINVVNYFAVSFGYPVFAAIGNLRPANLSVIAGALFFIFCVAILYLNGIVSAGSVAVSILLTELFVFLVRLYFFLKHKSTKDPL